MVDASADAKLILEIVRDTKEVLKINDLVNVAVGKENSIVKSYNFKSEDFSGLEKNKKIITGKASFDS